MSIFNLDQAPQRLPLKVLHALLEDEDAARDRPSFDELGQGHGSRGCEVEIVGRSQSEVGEDLQVAHAVGAELEVAGRGGVFSGFPL